MLSIYPEKLKDKNKYFFFISINNLDQGSILYDIENKIF